MQFFGCEDFFGKQLGGLEAASTDFPRPDGAKAKTESFLAEAEVEALKNRPRGPASRPPTLVFTDQLSTPADQQ